MNRGIYTLMVAQFLTAFADNAILFAAFAMLSEMASVGEWYKPALQGAFLLAFVVLAPWVGRFADRHAKRSVLTIGNAIKALGALLLMLNLEPLLAYAVVGIGAAVYGPAKYGILPELTGHKKLVKANALIEGSTIIAIVLGAVIGANIADQSISYALLLIVTAYLLSLVGSLLVPKTTSKTQPPTGSAIRHFGTMPGSRYFCESLFWASKPKQTAKLHATVYAFGAPTVLRTLRNHLFAALHNSLSDSTPT
ncbi:MFS transporter [Candidatus Reidiella endopervernicosa]|uniref:MFS transporter n=1 Tax=Candidatus Reidiella endopervernicosa TaxID=2738883 RepID=A0A6N0HRL7_9GAMM|nr:MFS transporter [Candidatus Reidiella endopervernicosa]QKQ25059.1 MFS transporter [Candidatus Reidiella endopervernicosa]